MAKISATSQYYTFSITGLIYSISCIECSITSSAQLTSGWCLRAYYGLSLCFIILRLCNTRLKRTWSINKITIITEPWHSIAVQLQGAASFFFFFAVWFHVRSSSLPHGASCGLAVCEYVSMPMRLAVFAKANLCVCTVWEGKKKKTVPSTQIPLSLREKVSLRNTNMCLVDAQREVSRSVSYR